MEIKPGLSIKIVLNIDHIKETSDVRNSLIYDIIEKKLIIAQTYPPILKSEIKQTVILTYLAKGKANPVRYRLDAAILKLLNDYELSTGNTTQAVILLSKSDPIEYNLRFFFRVEPPSNVGLDILVYRKPVNIIDISIGGAKISHNRTTQFEQGKIISATLSIDGIPFHINAVVARIWEPHKARMAQTLEFVALEFMDTSMHFKNLLGRKIFNIQRDLRYKEIA